MCEKRMSLFVFLSLAALVAAQGGEVSNCQVVDPANPGTCIICVYGYFASPIGCSQVSEFCDGHNVQTGDCFGCKYGLQLTSGKCLDQNCVRSGENGCLKCKSRFNLNGEGVCAKNDPKCSRSVTGRCESCLEGSYLEFSGWCQDLPPNCAIPNRQTGKCLQCLPSFEMSSVGAPCLQKIVIENCQVPDAANPNRCLICTYGFYPEAGKCMQVSSLCREHNVQNGQCLSCVNPSRSLENGKCMDKNCEARNGEKCDRCALNFKYDIQDMICKFVPQQIFATKNQQQGITILQPQQGITVLQPQQGITILKPQDIMIQSPQQQTETQKLVYKDPNCRSYGNGTCKECSNGYYYGQMEGKCVPVNPLCKASSNTGECTECYDGYTLNSGACMISTSRDPNCKQYRGETCIQCSSGFYYSPDSVVCKKLNPLCKTSDLINGRCLSCYPGYQLNTNNGQCAVFFKDPTCKIFAASGDCSECIAKHYLKAGKCIMVNPLCKAYNPMTGSCTSCYPGYIINAGSCEEGIEDPNCKKGQGKMCMECFPGFYLELGLCKQVSPLCKGSNPSTGACTSCYPGYELKGGSCQLETTRDPNCKKFQSSDSNYCMTCYSGLIALNGQCKKQNPLCKTINNESADCQSCWPGYVLQEGQCLLPSKTVAAASGPVDPYCIKQSNQLCIECSRGYYLNQQTQTCALADPRCKTHNAQDGTCVSCYPGFTLNSSRCLAYKAVQIANCQTTDQSGRCSNCIQGYYLKDNKCQAVSILCVGYAMDGRCTSCHSGYFLQDGECIYPAMFDANCIHYQNAFCSNCQTGFILRNYRCQPI